MVSIVLLDEVIEGSGDEIGLECVAVCKLHSNVCVSSNHVLVQRISLLSSLYLDLWTYNNFILIKKNT